MLRPRDQHGFATQTPCFFLFGELLAGPLVLLYLLLFENKSPRLASWILKQKTYIQIYIIYIYIYTRDVAWIIAATS